MTMLTKIPFLSPEDGAAFHRAIRVAAREMHLSEHQVAVIAADFFACIAQEVAAGKRVVLPGFGVFEPVVKRGPKHTRVAPRFRPARGFRKAVRETCPPDAAEAGGAVLRKVQRRHHPTSRPDRLASRTFTGMAAFRQRIEADARRMGMSVRGLDPWGAKIGG
jgi:hypothetical protein